MLALRRPGARGSRLFRRYFLWMLALVTGVLLVSGGIGLFFSYRENLSALSNLQHEKAVAAAERIQQFLVRIEQLVKFTGSAMHGTDSLDARRIEFHKALRQAPAITALAQLDPRGNRILTVSRVDLESDAADAVGAAEAYRAAVDGTKGGESWFGPVYFRKDSEPYMRIAWRARNGAGLITVADVNLKFILDVVSAIHIGKHGKAYVVDNSGHLVADPDIGRVLRKTDLSALTQVRDARSDRMPEELAQLAYNDAGQRVLTAFAPVDAADWRVLVEQPVSEVYASLNASIARTALLMLGGLVIAGLSAMWLARGLVQPIREVQQGAQRIGAGQLDQRIDLHTGDELQELAEQFNRMSSQLRESYAGLERQVDDRTRDLRESLEHQTAISDVLRVLGQSPTTAHPAFEAILDHAIAVCVADVALLWLFDGEALSIVAQRNASALLKETPRSVRLLPGFESPTSQAALERRTISVVNPFKSGIYPPLGLMATDRVGSVLAAPIARDQMLLGVLTLCRRDPSPFGDKQIALVETFAHQAGIAVENVRLFEEIQQTNQKLQAADRHKSEFLANMSHELRTPLNAIIGFSEVLIENLFGELNAKQADYLQDIHTSGRHLLSLINDILDLSKVEAGRMELELGEFEVRDVIEHSLTLVRERAMRRAIELSLDVDPGVTTLLADERKFKQIVLNLLSNAVKFTPDGGRVHARARLVEDSVEVSVSDSGIGIADEDKAAVFEDFRQVGRDYATKNEGTGLGLALSRRFVELHDGRICFDSQAGVGSTFTFTIPHRASPTPCT